MTISMRFGSRLTAVAISVAVAFVSALAAQTTCGIPQWSIVPGSASGITAAGVIAVADFNHDGHADVLALSTTVFRVVPGTGTGTAPADGTYYTAESGAQFSAMTVADFDKDGYADAAVSDSGLGRILLFKGSSDGIVHAPIVTSLALLPRALAAGDFDSDGKLDLVAASWQPASLVLLSGDGAGHFAATTAPGIPSTQVVKLLSGDINGDGYTDLVASHDSSSDVDVMFGSGSGVFLTAVAVSMGRFPGPAIAIADIDNDGDLDLVAAASDDLTVTVSRNSGTTYSMPSTYSVARSGLSYTQTAKGVAVADFTGDGNVDIAVSHGVLDELAVLRGNGDGSFRNAAFTSAGGTGETFPSCIAPGDFDEDGAADLVMFDTLNRKATLALNRCGFSAVTATPVYKLVSRFQNSTVNVVVKGLNALGAAPTGIVSVKQDWYVLTTAPLVNGSATIDVPGLAGPAGVQTLTVEYGGDDTFGPSTTTYDQKTTDAVTTVTIKFQSPTYYLEYGVNYSAVATVATSNSYAPSGALTFVKDDVNVNASLYSGQSTLNLAGESVATHTVGAIYGGDATHPPGRANPTTYTVAQGTPQFDFSNWRDVSALGSTFSTSVYFAGTSYGSSPTGKVTVKVEGAQVASLSAGQSYYFSKQLAFGYHFFEASYPGDTNWAARNVTKVHRVVAAGSFSLNATTKDNRSCMLAWTPYAGAYQYKLVRWLAAAGPATATATTYPSATTSCTEYLPSDSVFIYQVEAYDTAGSLLARSNPDLTMYSYAPFVIPGQLITARSVYDARDQVDRLRRALSLTAWPWQLSYGTKVIRATHIEEVRDVLNQTLAKIGMPPVMYSAPQLTPGITVIRAADIEEINQVMR